MDELKLALRTKFMKSIVAKMLSKAIYKKTGYDVDIQFDEVKAETHGGKISVQMIVKAEMNSDDLVKILKNKDLL